MDQPLPCIYALVLAFRCAISLSDVLLRLVPALLLWSPAAGHQLQPALLPPLRGLHCRHPAPYCCGHPARAHPQLLPAKHDAGVHSVGGSRELPAVLWGSRGVWQRSGAGEGRTDVLGQRTVGAPPAVSPSCRCQHSSHGRKDKQSTGPRFGKRTKGMPVAFPAVGKGGREPCELVT